MAETSLIRSTQQSRLPELLAAASVGTLVLTATWAFREMGHPVFDAVATAAPPQSLLHIVVLLSVSLVFSYSWAISLRRRLRHPTSADFDFDRKAGYYVDRKTKLAICPCCLSKDPPRVVHMQEHPNNAKICHSCDKIYPNGTNG